jgi:alpha-L-rhamnosidase
MRRFLFSGLICCLCSISIFSKGKEVRPLPIVLTDLRVENLTNPLGIDNVSPHFSWKLKGGVQGSQQTHYEILVASDSVSLIKNKSDLWHSGIIASDMSVMVPYKGKELHARSLCFWKVRIWDEKGHVTKWSNIARFGIGILDFNQWHGAYIGLSPAGGNVGAPILYKKIKLANVKTSFLHVNSLGYHEIYINGKKVGKGVLCPAVSQLDKRSLSVTYDVTSYLKRGENDLLIWLGKGWYKDTTFGAVYNGPLVRAELDELVNDNWRALAVTDLSWKGCESGYTDTGTWRALQFGGERLDARTSPKSFSHQTLCCMKWYPVTIVNVAKHLVSPQMCEMNIIEKTTKAVSIKQVGENVWLLDMGRVLTGWFEMNLPQLSRGQELKMEYSDYVNDKGEFQSQGESDIYIASGDRNEHFCNKFNHHAFRYVRISNLRLQLKTDWFEAHQIYGDYHQASTFECSDKNINAIHNMIQYTLRCLTFSGYMVDCPHLERSGYGGDGNSSTMALQTMYDVSPTFMNWLQAWSDVMREGGSLPHVAPNPGAGGGGPYWCGFMIQAPWRTFLNYGDSRMINRYYTNMNEWLGYVDKYTINGLLKRWPDTKYRDWYLGDWLPPMGVDAGAQSSVDLVNNCFISQCLGTMKKVALFLGKQEEAEGFSVREERLNQLIHQTFYQPEKCIYATGSQLDMIYPMLVGAVPDSLYNKVKEKMLDTTEQRYKGHISCGLVGVPILTEWAIKNKEVDFIYQMLKKSDYPGYLYMINHGATTTWEYWSGERSHVHNCYNGIGLWFYQALGGLLLDEEAPAYRHVFIDPQIPNGMTWAKISKECPYGRIGINWKLVDSELNYQVEIPIGVTATVYIPQKVESFTINGKNSDKIDKVNIYSGKYNFKFIMRK